MSEPLPEAIAAQIKAALAAGNKIEAIKLYREFSGTGLAEAKAFIEQLAERRSAPVGIDEGDPIQQALFAGRKIEAVRLYREKASCGLKEAKTHIDGLETELRSRVPERFTAPPRAGCGVGVLLLMTFAVVALVRVLGLAW